MADQDKRGSVDQGDQKKDPRKDINQKGGQTARDVEEDDMNDMSDFGE